MKFKNKREQSPDSFFMIAKRQNEELREVLLTKEDAEAISNMLKKMRKLNRTNSKKYTSILQKATGQLTEGTMLAQKIFTSKYIQSLPLRVIQQLVKELETLPVPENDEIATRAKEGEEETTLEEERDYYSLAEEQNRELLINLTDQQNKQIKTVLKTLKQIQERDEGLFGEILEAATQQKTPSGITYYLRSLPLEIYDKIKIEIEKRREEVQQGEKKEQEEKILHQEAEKNKEKNIADIELGLQSINNQEIIKEYCHSIGIRIIRDYEIHEGLKRKNATELETILYEINEIHKVMALTDGLEKVTNPSKKEERIRKILAYEHPKISSRHVRNKLAKMTMNRVKRMRYQKAISLAKSIITNKLTIANNMPNKKPNESNYSIPFRKAIGGRSESLGGNVENFMIDIRSRYTSLPLYQNSSKEIQNNIETKGEEIQELIQKINSFIIDYIHRTDEQEEEKVDNPHISHSGHVFGPDMKPVDQRTAKITAGEKGETLTDHQIFIAQQIEEPTTT